MTQAVTALLSSVKEQSNSCDAVLMKFERLTEAQYQDAEREFLEALATMMALMVRLRERRV